MKLLLDEMWPRSVAEQLRARGHDAVAIAERIDLRTQPDEVVFAAAQADQRVIVTEDIRGYRRLAADAIRSGEWHAGVILTSNQVFPRSNPRTFGRVVSSLHELLMSGVDLTGREYWLS